MASGSLAIHEVLPPEQNAVPAPVTTTARSVAVGRQVVDAAAHASVIASDMALRWSGLSRVSSDHPGAGPGDLQRGVGHGPSVVRRVPNRPGGR